MDQLTRAHAEDRPPDLEAVIAAIPYCRFMGLRAEMRDNAPLLVLPFSDCLIGNPNLPALHGGVIGSLLETAAILQVIWQLKSSRLPKPVDVAVDFLRSGRAVTSYARARIAKQGRRVINVHAEMWQDDEAKPIAALRGHMMLPPADA